MAMTRRDYLAGAGLMEMMRRAEAENSKRLEEIGTIFGDGVKDRVADEIYSSMGVSFDEILRREKIEVEKELR